MAAALASASDRRHARERTLTVSPSRMDMPFTGSASFLRVSVLGPDDPVTADLVVLGAPTDEGSPFMPGSRFGPRSIREHSLRFVSDEPGYFDPTRAERRLQRERGERRIVDLGDADVIPTNVVAPSTTSRP